jgi:hypothetical protein
MKEYKLLTDKNIVLSDDAFYLYNNSTGNVRYLPLSCPLTSNIALKDKNLRKLCVENYNIF